MVGRNLKRMIVFLDFFYMFTCIDACMVGIRCFILLFYLLSSGINKLNVQSSNFIKKIINIFMKDILPL